MSKLKLKNGASFDLIKTEIEERRDYIKYIFAVPEDITIEEVEDNFVDPANTEIVYVTDDNGEILRSITEYTKYKSLEKTKTSISVKMGIQDWQEKYDELKSMIDILMTKIG